MMRCSESLINEKTSNLTEAVQEIAEALRSINKTILGYRLIDCVNSVPSHISQAYQQAERINKIRYWVKAKANLEQCRSYMELIGKMSLTPTNGIIGKIDEISDLLNVDYGYISSKINNLSGNN
jgi:four helix bundle protein